MNAHKLRENGDATDELPQFGSVRFEGCSENVLDLAERPPVDWPTPADPAHWAGKESRKTTV